MKLSRGYRNCNPGNIEINGDKFQGEISPSKDKRFKQFSNMAYGYRAMFRILLTYKERHALKTIRQWITRWAPPKENDTEAYIKAVSVASGLPDYVDVNTRDKDMMCTIVATMSEIENGVPANIAEVESGFKLL